MRWVAGSARHSARSSSNHDSGTPPSCGMASRRRSSRPVPRLPAAMADAARSDGPNCRCWCRADARRSGLAARSAGRCRPNRGRRGCGPDPVAGDALGARRRSTSGSRRVARDESWRRWSSRQSAAGDSCVTDTSTWVSWSKPSSPWSRAAARWEADAVATAGQGREGHERCCPRVRMLRRRRSTPGRIALIQPSVADAPSPARCPGELVGRQPGVV